MANNRCLLCKASQWFVTTTVPVPIRSHGGAKPSYDTGTAYRFLDENCLPLDAIQVSKEIIPRLEGVKNAVFKILAITKIFLIVDHTKIQCTIEIIQKNIYKMNIYSLKHPDTFTHSTLHCEWDIGAKPADTEEFKEFAN